MYVVTKYKGKWAVIDTHTNVYYGIGSGKAACIKLAYELNNGL